MPALTDWRYLAPLGVEAGELQLKVFEEREALRVHGAVAGIWLPGAEQPVVRRLRHRTARAGGGRAPPVGGSVTAPEYGHG